VSKGDRAIYLDYSIMSDAHFVRKLTAQSLQNSNTSSMEDKFNKAVFGSQNPNSKFFFRHLHGDLNLDKIKNALRLLSVNGETNLMNLIRL